MLSDLRRGLIFLAPEYYFHGESENSDYGLRNLKVTREK